MSATKYGTEYTVVKNDIQSIGSFISKDPKGNFNHAEMKIGSYINDTYRGRPVKVDIAVENTGDKIIGLCNPCIKTIPNLGKQNPNMTISVFHGSTKER